jgi:hypothetical protein
MNPAMSEGRLRARAWGALALAAGLARSLAGRRLECVLCGKRVPCFLPWRGGAAGAPPLMRHLMMIGSDLDHFACPACGCSDRDRHLRLYLERSALIGRFVQARVLHFAPEPPLERWWGTMPATYVRADLHPTREGIERMDLQSLPLPDASIDVLVANHVLEHVDDLDAATSEIVRVLEPGGIAILQTPWCAGLTTTIEDRAVATPEARRHLYGQSDHVRLFGRDVYERIGRTGLRPTPRRHADLLVDIDPARYGVNPHEELMLFLRP